MNCLWGNDTLCWIVDVEWHAHQLTKNKNGDCQFLAPTNSRLLFCRFAHAPPSYSIVSIRTAAEESSATAKLLTQLRRQKQKLEQNLMQVAGDVGRGITMGEYIQHRVKSRLIFELGDGHRSPRGAQPGTSLGVSQCQPKIWTAAAPLSENWLFAHRQSECSSVHWLL
jgi:hypothetical protein